MIPLILAISIIGAIAVISFVIAVVLGGLRRPWPRSARRMLAIAAVAGGVCAVLGAVIPLVSS